MKEQIKGKSKFWNDIPSPCVKREPPSPERLWESALNYFNWCFENDVLVVEIYGKNAVECDVPKMRIPTIAGVKNFAGVNEDQWYGFFEDERYRDVVLKIKSIVEQVSLEGASSGALQQNIVSAILGLVKRTEIAKVEKESVVLYIPDNGRRIAQLPPQKVEIAEYEDDEDDLLK